MNNVISMRAFKDAKEAGQSDLAYHAKILSMSKVELLDEMVRFQQERSRTGELTTPMMIQGRYLFRALEQSAETEELRILTRAYRRHLEFELAQLKQNQS
ncbi:MAG: hypothetical protein A2583_03975 [Bdellovibrionales bacterium RIFOXYD1_FULL_53_11]|nr:MAG: hypothetical protein A2583_03975 [Bdellovibrionales bacterium RIFOXYD1_FULL_53_11]